METSNYDALRIEIYSLYNALINSNELLKVRCECGNPFDNVTAEIIKGMSKGIGSINTSLEVKAHVAIKLLLPSQYKTQDNSLIYSSTWYSRLYDFMTSETPNDPNVILDAMGFKLDKIPTADDLKSDRAFILFIVGDEIFDQFLIHNLKESDVLMYLGISKKDLQTIQNVQSQWENGKLEAKFKVDNLKSDLIIRELGVERKYSNYVRIVLDNWNKYDTDDDRMIYIATNMIDTTPHQKKLIRWINKSTQYRPENWDDGKGGKGGIFGVLQYLTRVLEYNVTQLKLLANSLLVPKTPEEFLSAYVTEMTNNKYTVDEATKFIDTFNNLGFGTWNDKGKYNDYVVARLLGITLEQYEEFINWSIYRDAKNKYDNGLIDFPNFRNIIFRKVGGDTVHTRIAKLNAIVFKEGPYWEQMKDKYNGDDDILVAAVMNAPIGMYDVKTAYEEIKNDSPSKSFMEFLIKLSQSRDISQEQDEENLVNITDREHLKKLGLDNNKIEFMMNNLDLLSILSDDVRNYIKNKLNNSVSYALKKTLGDRFVDDIFRQISDIKDGNVNLYKVLYDVMYDKASERMTDEFIHMIKTNIRSIYYASIQGRKSPVNAVKILSNVKTAKRFEAMLKPGGIGGEKTFDMLGYYKTCCRGNLLAPTIIAKSLAFKTHQDRPDSKIASQAILNNTTEDRKVQVPMRVLINTSRKAIIPFSGEKPQDIDAEPTRRPRLFTTTSVETNQRIASESIDIDDDEYMGDEEFPVAADDPDADVEVEVEEYRSDDEYRSDEEYRSDIDEDVYMDDENDEEYLSDNGDDEDYDEDYFDNERIGGIFS